jgi:hypothetical protein
MEITVLYLKILLSPKWNAKYYFNRNIYFTKFKFKFFIDMKSNKGLSSATIQSTDIHKT